MKRILSSAVLFGLLSLIPASAATLVATASATPSGALYDYSYTFTISGSGLTLTDIFLATDDLSPLNVSFTFDNNPTSNWSWFSNNKPSNYIDFFNSAGGTLGASDNLGVTFRSFLAPSATHTAVGENINTGTVSNTVTSLVAPGAAVPEPASLSMVLLGIGAACSLAIGRSRRLTPGRSVSSTRL